MIEVAYIYYNPNPCGKHVGDCVIRAVSKIVNNDDWYKTYVEITTEGFRLEEFFNVSRAINAQIWKGCCETIAVRNTSDQPILVQNANIIFSRPDLLMSR